MKKVLITGGTGTVGKAFIKQYYNDFEFQSFSYDYISYFFGDIIEAFSIKILGRVCIE